MIRTGQHGSASWWLLIALLLVGGGIGVYLWQEPEAPPAAPRPIPVAVADTSGPISYPDTIRATTESIDSISSPPVVFVAPPPGFVNPSAVPFGSFLDYARRMQFDPSRGLELVLSPDGGDRKVVRLEPLVNLRQLDSVAFTQGRILARIWSGAALSDPPLHSGENYLWVRGQLGGSIRAEVWSISAFAPVKPLLLTYSPHPPRDAPQGKDAFWIGADNTNKVLWIVCGGGWCHS